jgi:hypothetical protein
MIAGPNAVHSIILGDGHYFKNYKLFFPFFNIRAMKRILFLSIFFNWHTLQAQQLPDTTFLSLARKNIVSNYKQSIQGQTGLYNGSEYKRDYGSDDEHRFFKNDDWTNGEVTYENHHYEDIPLLYDITIDRVITENFYNASEMILVYEKLSHFKIGNNVFVKLNDKSLPKPGFYEVLYDGPSRVLSKRIKVMREEIAMRNIYIHFDQKDKFYILKNGAYLQVRNRSSVLKVFEDKKAGLKEFVRTNKPLFKLDFAEAVKLTAAYYDTLK